MLMVEFSGRELVGHESNVAFADDNTVTGEGLAKMFHDEMASINLSVICD